MQRRMEIGIQKILSFLLKKSLKKIWTHTLNARDLLTYHLIWLRNSDYELNEKKEIFSEFEQVNNNSKKVKNLIFVSKFANFNTNRNQSYITFLIKWNV